MQYSWQRSWSDGLHRVAVCSCIDGHTQIRSSNPKARTKRATTIQIAMPAPRDLCVWVPWCAHTHKITPPMRVQIWTPAPRDRGYSKEPVWAGTWQLKNRRVNGTCLDMEPMELPRHPVKWDFGENRKRISGEAQSLASLKFSSLPRNIDLITAFLCGSALLNDRDRVCEKDFETLNKLKPYFGWYR